MNFWHVVAGSQRHNCNCGCLYMLTVNVHQHIPLNEVAAFPAGFVVRDSVPGQSSPAVAQPIPFWVAMCKVFQETLQCPAKEKKRMKVSGKNANAVLTRWPGLAQEFVTGIFGKLTSTLHTPSITEYSCSARSSWHWWVGQLAATSS